MKAWIVLTATWLVLVRVGLGFPFTDNVAGVAGTWEGESKCIVADSPCRDEHVIYKFAADKHAANRLTVDAYKVVNGQQEFMGTLECTYHVDRGSLSCTANTPRKDDWEFKVEGDNIIGTLTLGDEKTLYRRVHVTRK